MKKTDYYEFLQISPNAEEETIHRVYRFLAARYHPDNPDSGDAGKFSILATAYEVLSNPHLRSEYDSQRGKGQSETAPLSSTIDFMDQMEGENNRRVALLAVLYFKRRSSPLAPEVSLAEVEARMGFPRDYLDFTTWYLQKKGFITRADNSDFTLTAAGVDFVESQRVNIPILNKLLTAGAETAADHSAGVASRSGPTIDESALEGLFRLVDGAISILPSGVEIPKGPPIIDRRRLLDRRSHSEDQRVGLPDQRVSPIERRMAIYDRRRNLGDRRASVANGIAVETNGHGDAAPGPTNRDRPRDYASAVDRLIAMVDESMDAIYGHTGELANSFKDQLAESVRE
ncbi:MAG TPA: J domain-containing protein [Acidobacteriaceae bacterium]|nr:J domain-containing protein [Acidobacteriaceae bacterium]